MKTPLHAWVGVLARFASTNGTRRDSDRYCRAWVRRCVTGPSCGVLLWFMATLPTGVRAESDKNPAETRSNRETWWAFQPLAQPSVPTFPSRVLGNPVDAFLLRRLSERGLDFNPEASPRERLRRLYYDLIGLPPTPQEVVEFERDPSEYNWSRRVEALLASPQYGERWGRYWLDVVRFAQSNGYERDAEKPHAWRYRDYVVQAFNQDKPYDQFIREQIAGDELASGLMDSDGRAGQAWKDAMVATGFLRLGVHDDEPDDKLQAEYDELDDMVSASGAAFLGMTVGCARCHDHKFDPIPQRDYYSMVAVFRPLKSSWSAEHGLDSPLLAPLASPTQIADWKAQQEVQRRDLEDQLAKETEAELRKKLVQKIADLQKAELPFEWALAARERSDAIPAVHILSRGNPRSPGEEVLPGFLRAAGDADVKTPLRSGSTAASSGRRRALAEWIASPRNPLTARVMVNRVWHHHFGRGLVRTTTDFGRVGSLPSHPELLDWLAGEFIRSGWSVKALHRLILNSAAWQQSSSTSVPLAQTVDPANELLWRQNLRRLDAEALRDTLLTISGQLNLKAGGRGFFPALNGEVLAGGSRPGTDWQVSPAEELARRSIYSFIRRTSMVPIFEAFDYSNATSPLSERPVTTVAPQALLLLNDSFVQEQASSLADRVIGEASSGTLEQQILRAWSLATCRNPTREELRQLSEFFHRQVRLFEGLRGQISFRPDVPDTLSVPYFQALPAARFFITPGSDWQCSKGYWPREYEGNRALESGRGPLALWTGTLEKDGELEVDVIPQVACSQVGLLWRATAPADGTGETGYELVLEPREKRASLRKLTPTQSTVLATTTALHLREDRIQVRIRIQGDDFQIFFHGSAQPDMEVHADPGMPLAGQLGVRAWGAGVSLDQLRWTASGRTIPLWPHRSAGWVHQKALESVCLLIMNLNEVAYVD